MLAKTSDVLSRAGIGSLAELEQRLYEELEDATTADLLNRAVGDLFANAYMAIHMVSIRSGSTGRQVRTEERRLLFSGKGNTEQVKIPNFTHAKNLSSKPVFLDISSNGRSLVFSKTLLGSFVGDLFAVNGVYAGADDELGHPMASVLGQSYFSNGLTPPLISVMMTEWANNEKGNSAFSRFAMAAGLRDGKRNNYQALVQRLARSARRLEKTGFIGYESKNPQERNFYVASGKEFTPADLPDHIGRDIAIAVFSKLNKSGYVNEIAEQTHYGPSYVQRTLKWFADNGYAMMVRGRPAAKRSAVYGTGKSRRLLKYLKTPMGLVGFQPQANGIGSVWAAPRIDIQGIVDYRMELIDPLTTGNAKERFEEACRAAYQRHMAEFKKGN